MPNKLADNEIIKALDYCLQTENQDMCANCDICPCGKYQTECQREMLKQLSTLINRLQAENERLKRRIEDLESTQEISPEAQYLVDTKADKIISLLDELNKSQEQLKAEAYKEFAERLKEKELYCSKNGTMILEGTIDNLLNELVGDNNGNRRT